MPARKRRLGLTETPKAFVAAEVRALHTTATRAEAWLDKLNDVRAQPLDLAGPEAAPVELTPARRSFWPFGRKVDTAQAKTKAILTDLEASVSGRPQASAELAAARTPALPDAGVPAAPQARRAWE